MALKMVWEADIILLSYAVSVLGCIVGVYLTEQYRLNVFERKGILNPDMILWLIAISIGGVGVWAMHFIGMEAVQLIDSNTREVLPMSYDIFLTVVSLLAVIICVYLGLYISTRDRVFFKDTASIGEMLLADGQKLSFNDARNPSKIRFLALFKGLQPLVLGGILVGTGVCIMHYIGMVAQVSSVSTSWNGGVVFASVLIAVIVAIVALWILFRLLTLYPKYEVLRLVCALVMGVAACGMHYTGMYAATYERTETVSKALTYPVDSTTAWTACISGGVLVAIFMLMLSIADIRMMYYKAAATLKHHARIIKEMESTNATDAERFKRTSISQGIKKSKPISQLPFGILSPAGNHKILVVEKPGSHAVQSSDSMSMSSIRACRPDENHLRANNQTSIQEEFVERNALDMEMA